MSKLRLVLPVSHVDSGLMIRAMWNLYKLRGDRPLRSPITLIMTKRASADAAKLCYHAEVLAGGGLDIHILRDEHEFGHPQASNHLFIRSAEIVEGLEEKLPWYFMEADNTALDPLMLEKLEQEYYSCGKPFLGPWDALKEYAWTAARYPCGCLNGSSIYPANLREFVPWLFEISIPLNAWDLMMSANIVPHIAPSQLMIHRWRASGVGRVDGYYTGTYGEQRRPFKEKDKGQVVFHGVKTIELAQKVKNWRRKKRGEK